MFVITIFITIFIIICIIMCIIIAIIIIICMIICIIAVGGPSESAAPGSSASESSASRAEG